MNWALLAGISLAWGGSFAFVKLGLEHMPPLTLSALRVLIAAALLTPLAWKASGGALDTRSAVRIGIYAGLGICVPFSLIAVALQSASSAESGVIVGSSPLFGFLLASRFLSDEPFSWRRASGLGLGFVGVFLVLGPTFDADPAWDSRLLVVVAALAYAAGNVYVRARLGAVPPLTLAWGAMTISIVPMAALSLAFESPSLPTALEPGALASLAWLAIPGTAGAYVASFQLLVAWGAVRASLASYLIPVVAMGFGLFLGETITQRLVLGAILVLVGVLLVGTSQASKADRRAPLR